MALSGPKPNLTGGSEPKPFIPTGDAPSESLIPSPAQLSLKARGKWDIIMSDMASMRVYKASDVIMLTELCESLAMLERFRMRMVALPDSQLGSPEAKVLRTGYAEYFRIANTLADNYGLGPVPRMRLGLLKIHGTTLGQKLVSEGMMLA